MLVKILVVYFISFVVVSVGSEQCYFNRPCPYGMFSTRTPYDAVRGDIRHLKDPENCSSVSLWSFHRHGNRNPSSGVIRLILGIISLSEDIVASYDAGRGAMCAQDIDGFRRWTWNSTIETSPAYLTGVGYEELHDLGARFRKRYPHLLQSKDKLYFRPTEEQRTVASADAFIRGLTDGTDLNVTYDEPWARDDVIRPYKTCDRHQKLIYNGDVVTAELKKYTQNAEVIAVRDAVQRRLGLTHQLTTMEVYSMYELCGFTRSWEPNARSPWCSIFTNEDLVVMEYGDDVRHYYNSGYGSWVNMRLGEVIMADLYVKFNEFVHGEGKNIVSYFSHDTAMDMTYVAMGLFKDSFKVTGASRDDSRLWKTSHIAPFAGNIIAVLNSCHETGGQSYRVQLFVNEKETTLCPAEGCTWEQFVNIFQGFTETTLDFCSLEYQDALNVASGSRAFLGCIAMIQIIYFCFMI